MDRIAPGHHLYPGPDGTWRHSSPDGRLTRIRGPHPLMAAVRESAYKSGHTEVTDDVRALLDALRERGVLIAEDRHPAGRPDDSPEFSLGRVHVEGDSPVAAAVADLLGPETHVTTGRVDEDAVRAADAVVSCAGWLPDAHWRRVDAWCAQHATPWHRCHAEGLRWVTGPLFVPGVTVGYADTRGRILAADDLPDELAVQWAYLDQGHTSGAEGALPPVPWPSAAGAAVLAGLLVEDLRRALASGTPTARDTQLVVDLATASITRHRVLPLPTTADAA